jgi:hypothetical protein
MLPGNRCEDCKEPVHGPRAAHRQTKFCVDCAKRRKKEQTKQSRPAVDRRESHREYMRKYRPKHPGISTPYVRKFRDKQRYKTGKAVTPQSSEPDMRQLDFETLKAFIGHLSIIVVEATGLLVIFTYCLKHIVDIWMH